MHSHDRTLLAKLGFNDADRKDPLHDLASQYLALPHNAERILRMCGYEHVLTFREYWSPQLEKVICKGEGKYMSTVGFADLYIAPVVIEVKIARCSASDLTRQLSLYRLHLAEPGPRPGTYEAAAAVAFDVSPSFVQALESSRIKLVRLGPKFREWASEQQASSAAAVEEI